jgi:hypothetical protein
MRTRARTRLAIAHLGNHAKGRDLVSKPTVTRRSVLTPDEQRHIDRLMAKDEARKAEAALKDKLPAAALIVLDDEAVSFAPARPPLTGTSRRSSTARRPVPSRWMAPPSTLS